MASSSLTLALATALTLLGPPVAGAIPFGDDFESGSLGDWDVRLGQTAVTSATSHHGYQSLKIPRSSAPQLVAHHYSPRARRLSVEFSYRHQRRGWISVAQLRRNRIVIDDDGRGRLRLRRGATRVALGTVKRSGNWNSIKVQLDVRRSRVRVLRNGRAAEWVRLPGLVPERTLWFGGARTAKGPLYIDSVNRRPLPSVVVPAPQRAAPPAPSALTPPPPVPPLDATPVIPPPLEPQSTPPGQLFAPWSIWNSTLGPHEPWHSEWQEFVGELQRQVNTYGAWINTTRYSTPIYRVPDGLPTVRVALTAEYGPALQAAWEQVPIPAGARPAVGDDGHLTIWQPETDTLWEFWQAEKIGSSWHAAWGARIEGVSQSDGVIYPVAGENWGATATSLPIIAGTITAAELRAGVIPHALAIAIPEPKEGEFVWPAQRTDGFVWSDVPWASQIPEGTMFRLPADYDMSQLNGAHPVTRMLATAARDHGIVVRDKAGAVAFFAEDPAPYPDDPYLGAFAHGDAAEVSGIVDRFPWADLVALEPFG